MIKSGDYELRKEEALNISSTASYKGTVPSLTQSQALVLHVLQKKSHL